MSCPAQPVQNSRTDQCATPRAKWSIHFEPNCQQDRYRTSTFLTRITRKSRVVGRGVIVKTLPYSFEDMTPVLKPPIRSSPNSR